MKVSLSFFVFYSYLLFYPAISLGQTDPNVFLGRFLDNRDRYPAYNANIDLALKYFSQNDTIYSSASVDLLRVPSDSIFGGHLYIEMDSMAYGYNGKVLFEINKHDATIQNADPIISPGLWIGSTWVNNYVDYSFLTYNQSARSILANTEIKHRVVDTLIDRLPCKAFFYYLPDEPEFTNTFILVAIDTIDLFVRRRITSTWFQENQQFSSWTYHNPSYSQQSSIAKLDSSFLSQYTLKEEYKPTIRDTALKYTIDYSSLQGNILGQDKPVSLKEVSADVIILDFWYSSCYPCIKSIPEVNKLHERFKDKNVKVYGVNIIDDEAANKSRIEKYIRNNPMAYETIMADGKAYNSWVQNGYPTLLILDKNFKLIQEHTGYSEDMAEELSALITKYLENK
jgi:thiol-disulfide isomerase/thioredoxin